MNKSKLTKQKRVHNPKHQVDSAAHSVRSRRVVPMAELVRPGALLDRLMKKVLNPRANEIIEIATSGGIAVVMFEPGDIWIAAFRSHGIEGQTVFAMPEAAADGIARSDHVAKRWLARRWTKDGDPIRIFAAIQEGSLLLNLDPEGVYSVEPNSTDQHVLN